MLATIAAKATRSVFVRPATSASPVLLRTFATEPAALLPPDHGVRQLLGRVEADNGFRLISHLGMAATLARKGFQVTGYDINPARRAAVEAQGVGFSADLADALVFPLPLASDVEGVVTTAGGLLERHDRKVVVIDTSTSDPRTTRRLATQLAAAGHGLLDAPVSGGGAFSRRSHRGRQYGHRPQRHQRWSWPRAGS